jgi:hypothetical protein
MFNFSAKWSQETQSQSQPDDLTPTIFSFVENQNKEKAQNVIVKESEETSSESEISKVNFT